MTIEPYNYNDEPSGRTDTLIQALEKCERLEKQLKIAVEALKYIYDDTKKGHTQCDACGYCSSCETCINADWAEKALKKIKELEDKYNEPGNHN
jgi:predicted transcriptional regulator